MKTLVACAALLFAASHAFAETPAPIPAAPAEVKPVETKPIPAVKTPAKKEEKKPEKEPVIPGVTLVRPNGTFLGFEVVGGQVKVSFYDKKKKPMAIDVTRGRARWSDPRGPGEVRTPLNPSGTALLGVRPALPPFNYNIYILLLKGEGETADVAESYTIQYRG